MLFPSDISYYGNLVLRHDSTNHDCISYFIMRELDSKKVDAQTKKQILSEYKLNFCNHFVETSHFINFVSNNSLSDSFRTEFFSNLFIYIKQFYSDVELIKNIDDISSLRILFNNCYGNIRKIMDQFLDNYDMKYISNNAKTINEIFNLYSVIEEFMIRFYDYSIVGILGQKYIITSSNNCEKKFLDQLIDGYSLFRLQKIRLVKKTGNMLNSYYEFCPVLPTKDVGLFIHEYIETLANDNKIENRKFVKLLK